MQECINDHKQKAIKIITTDLSYQTGNIIQYNSMHASNGSGSVQMAL